MAEKCYVTRKVKVALENMLTDLIHKYGFEAKEVIRFAAEMEKAKTYEDAWELSLMHLELMDAEL